MRIIAGEYRSRILKSLPGDNTRPTQDKVKEAVFSHLGTYFDDGRILDLFSGSGAVGLEAVSRGFTEALLVDKSHEAVRVIKENVASLKAEEYCEVWCMDYHSALTKCGAEERQFDLIYLDPPYRMQLGTELLKEIVEKNILAEKGTIVLETALDEDIVIPELFVAYKTAQYGKTMITYVRKDLL